MSRETLPLVTRYLNGCWRSSHYLYTSIYLQFNMSSLGNGTKAAGLRNSGTFRVESIATM